jgi:hypothetical protein
MLFDLQGKRRRVVQVTYLTLALLMGGGLVFFGIGSDVQGGLSDAFSGGGGDGGGNEALEKRIDKNEKRVAASPANSEALRKALVRDYYQLAVAGANQDGTFDADAKADLRRAAANWKAYLASEPKKVDTSLSNVALQVFDPLALNRPKEAEEAARVIAEQSNNPNAYLRLVQYAALASDTRTANLAAQKAVDLAPKAERKAVKAQADQLKNPQAAGAGGTTPQQ